MDSRIYMWLIMIVLIQLLSSGEAYVNRKRNGYLDNKGNKLDDENNDVDETIWKRHINQDGNELQQEKKAREEIDEEIEELLNRFKAAKRSDLDRVNDHSNRVSTGGWWFCPWCDGSKLIIEAAELVGCVCTSEPKITCKCPDESVKTPYRSDRLI